LYLYENLEVNKSNRQLLFERMNKVGGMPLKEFSLETAETQTEYQNLIQFIGESSGYYIYLHTTNSTENAVSICQNGFRYIEFDKTTDYVNNVDGLIYMLGIRKPYGNFTIIMQISASIKDYDMISTKGVDEEGEEIFILPPQYIKGYYDRTTKKVYPNSLFKK